MTKWTAQLPPGTPHPSPCPDCGGEMVLARSFYGGVYYRCRGPGCNGSHSAHPKTGAPIGLPADAATRAARVAAHAAFDKLWGEGRMTRKQAYQWLAGIMGMEEGACHFSQMNQAQCEQATRFIQTAGYLAIYSFSARRNHRQGGRATSKKVKRRRGKEHGSKRG